MLSETNEKEDRQVNGATEDKTAGVGGPTECRESRKT